MQEYERFNMNPSPQEYECSHGEGRLFCPESATEEFITEKNLAPDDEGKPTEMYSLNPNGSPGGIASLCSPNETASHNDARS